MCWKVFELFYRDFGMDSYSGAAMKRGNEALNASSLQFFRSVKMLYHFIATTFYSAFNA
jgi:hypothetical protein